MPRTITASEVFSKSEQQTLVKYFGNIDSTVFVLINLPEVVKGALFARYSRSAKSVRRLFLDEFVKQVSDNAPPKPSCWD